MRIKTHIRYLIMILAFTAFVNISLAAESVKITGNAYGEKIGLIHFDYKTAKNPDPTDVTLDNAKYYVGPTKQFRIKPHDAYFDGNTKTFIPGDISATSKISITDTNCDLEATGNDSWRNGCLINGYAWSDKIGWIIFDGQKINDAINEAIVNACGGLCSAPTDVDIANNLDTYPTQYWPRVKAINTTSNDKRLAITGFAWNEYTGWIRFSSDEGGNVGITTDADMQTSGNWGTWLDVGMDPDRTDVKIDVDGTDFTKSEKLGRHINGFAWSEKLGWIKFSKTGTDDIDFTTYTLWVPDLTPPILLAPENTWFSVGVNTGYPEITTVPEFISWEDFAIDPESGIDEFESKFFIEKTPDSDSSCIPPTIIEKTSPDKDESVVGIMNYDLYNGSNGKPDYRDFGFGDILRVIIPNVGRVQNVPGGYCKYIVQAKIVNDVNRTIYVGNHFAPSAKTPDYKNYFDPVAIYVRAGNPADSQVKVEPTPTNATAIADGKDQVKYRIDLLDIAGNPVVDIDCTGEPGCSGREVVVTANITNELTYDITGRKSDNTIRPVLYGNSVGSTSLTFTEDDNDIDDTTNPDLSWPVAVHTDGTNKWEVEVTKPGDYFYDIGLASYAPSGDFIKYDKPDTTFKKSLHIDSFNYRIYNDTLLGTSRQLKIPIAYAESYTKAQWETLFEPVVNWYSKTEACYDDADPTTVPDCDNTTIFPPSNDPRVATTGRVFAPSSTIQMNVTFTPPFVINNGNLEGEAGTDIITLSTPVNITFDVENKSSNASITKDDDATFSIDNIFDFYGSTQSAGLHTRYITNETSTTTDTPAGDEITQDSFYGWSDRNEYGSTINRYEMYMDGSKIVTSVDSETGALELTNMKASTTPFNDIFEYLGGHPGYKYYFNVNADDLTKTIWYKDVDLVAGTSLDPNKFESSSLNSPPSPITNLPSQTSSSPSPAIDDSEVDDSGLYFFSGKLAIPKIQEYTGAIDSEGKELQKDDPYKYDLGYIDRNDAVNFNLPPNKSKNKAIRFIIENYLQGNKVGGAKFRLIQEIAYRFEGQPITTIYPTMMSDLSAIDVMDTGLEATGTVAGKKIVTGRQFDIVSTEGTRRLQEQMRRNVAEMTAGIDDINCTTEDIILTAWPNATNPNSACIVEEGGKTYAYYYAPEGTLITIGNGTNDMTAPNMPYTLIVKGGGSLYIKSNIIYDTKSSFGMIVIAKEAGKDQANVFIDPAPTNISAVLYAEGSVMSRNAAGNIYYGPTAGRGSISELANQLYWRGSIASRNTIAGAGQGILPPGVKDNCFSDDTDLSCAQRYDFDYLRRFTVIQDDPITPTETTIANNGKFSGGGSCTGGVCTHGDENLSLITLNASGQFVQDESEIAATFVEKDPATVNNPPPGFSISGGLESLQVIR